MAFYRIREAADKIGVAPHVLRFWESQFPMLRPQKGSRGQRLYSDSDLQAFLRVKSLLYTEGYSIPGAKKLLKSEKSGQAGRAKQSVSDLELARDVLEELRRELRSLKELAKEI
jgi:DNA-binding transcriptional MerR regulator